MPRKAPLPPNWNEIRFAVYERADYCCEQCGMKFHHGTTKAKTAKRRDGKPMILTVHHIAGEHDHSDNNLVALCQRCHLRWQHWKEGDDIPSSVIRYPSWLTRRGFKVMPTKCYRNEKSET